MVRAIDAQQVILQIDHAEKVQQVQQRHPEMQQRYFEVQYGEEKRLQQKKVKDSEETRKAAIEHREQEQRDGSGRHRQEEEAHPGEAEQEETKLGGHINIKV